MLFTAILTAVAGAITLVHASPVANTGTTLDSRDLTGGYYDDPQCYLKGYFNPRSQPYGLYDGAQCPPSDSNPMKVYYTTLDLNHCLVNVNGQLKWGPHGDAFATCRDCESLRYYTNMLSCNCDNGVNGFVSTTIDLNEGIYQKDARLNCFETAGTLTIF